MILQRACCQIGVIWLIPLSLLAADGPLADVDLSASRVSPRGDVQLIGAEGGGHLRFDVGSK